MTDNLPNIDTECLRPVDRDMLVLPGEPNHKPRILLLYGSLRKRSYSRLLTEEAARVLRHLGADVRMFDPTGLPLVDEMSQEAEKVQELRELSLWSEAHVWCSPERHGTITGLMKTQIDWLPL
ncbi:UNVERIFIED_CONTAM: hypothetical protein GTU68_048743, partial [Idotea baltica]|nr:hypothetical protein [Idotea baltica]